jgi:hypothetical protein
MPAILTGIRRCRWANAGLQPIQQNPRHIKGGTPISSSLDKADKLLAITPK